MPMRRPRARICAQRQAIADVMGEQTEKSEIETDAGSVRVIVSAAVVVMTLLRPERAEPTGQSEAEREREQPDRAQIAQRLWQQVQRYDTDDRRQRERPQRSEGATASGWSKPEQQPEQHGQRCDGNGK
jgi:hypothetical protein